MDIDAYLDMSDDQVDNLLLGLNLDSKIDIKTTKNICKSCNSIQCKEYKMRNKQLISDYNKIYKSKKI